MKIAICVAAVAALVGTCYKSYAPGALAANDNVIEYQIQGDRYAVIVVREQGMSLAQAKKMARQRAAEITVENGDRFFVVESEIEVQMVRTGEGLDDANAFYGNMYQELIVEKDFSKQQTQAQPESSGQVVPALRLVFVIYPNKQGSKSIDACAHTPCGGE
jgi:mRNA degradation ribonuclease J1/J2